MRSSLLQYTQILRSSTRLQDPGLQTSISQRCPGYIGLSWRCVKSELAGQRKACGIPEQLATSHNGTGHCWYVNGQYALRLVWQDFGDYDIESGTGSGDSIHHDE